MSIGAGSCAVVLCEALTCTLRPTEALLHLRDDERPFAMIGAWAGGGAILGSEPLVVEEQRAVFDALDRQPSVSARTSMPGAVGGGWFGYLGFELSRCAERLDPAPPARTALPGGVVGFYDHVLHQDADGRWWFEALITPGRAALIEARRAELEARLGSAAQARRFRTSGWRWSPAPAGHTRVVEACRERIHAGDLFQANLAMRLEGRIDGDPIDLFAAAVARLPTDRAAYVGGPWGALASLSPELFLQRQGRVVRSAPIKGTRPRDRADELRVSEKDRAENVMIVDLMRNDLGRVCTPGSVRVDALAEVRPHAGVVHLVSEVSGRLRDDVGDADLLRATFPPGSVTGAPKIAALNVISELESSRREAYTGAIGFVSPLRGLELSVAIRTFEFSGSRAWLGAGGGIVADSTGADEAAEAVAKARPLLVAIGAALPSPPLTQRAVPPSRRHRARPVPRPDPAAGLYETARIIDGVVQRWPAHLGRLATSSRLLYGMDLPRDLSGRVTALGRGVSDGRIRIDLIPGEELRVQMTPNVARPNPILRPVLLPGGIGAHKWRDRTLLEAHEADDPETLPLLVDADGFVLETSRTGIVIQDVHGGRWTPRNDGRILPSTAVRAARARSRQLSIADLQAASAIYVASALRALQPATIVGSAGIQQTT